MLQVKMATGSTAFVHYGQSYFIWQGRLFLSGRRGSTARKSTYQTVQESVKGADGEIGVESKGGGSAEDEEAAVLFLLMTTSRGFAEKV